MALLVINNASALQVFDASEHFHHQVDTFRGSVRNQLRNADALLLREVKVDVRGAVLLELGEHFEVGRAEHLRRGRSETF